jgi:hypothetical protein
LDAIISRIDSPVDHKNKNPKKFSNQ